MDNLREMVAATIAGPCFECSSQERKTAIYRCIIVQELVIKQTKHLLQRQVSAGMMQVTCVCACTCMCVN